MHIPIEYRLLFIFSLIIAFLLSERQYAFDLKQRGKLFAAFFVAVLVSLVILYQLLQAVFEYLQT